MQVLHIHSDTVSCAVFQETNQGLLLTKGAHHHYSSDDELQACVQQQVAALFNPQERTIVAIPPQAYGFWNVSIPLMDRSKLIEVLPTEIMRELGKNQPVVVDVIKKADQEYLALWADMSVIQGIIDLLRFTGIDPEVITCPQLCWQHLLPATSTEAITLVDSHALTVFVDHLPLLARVSPQPIDASFIKTSTAVLTFTGQPDVTKVFAIGPSTSEAPPPYLYPTTGISETPCMTTTRYCFFHAMLSPAAIDPQISSTSGGGLYAGLAKPAGSWDAIIVHSCYS